MTDELCKIDCNQQRNLNARTEHNYINLYKCINKITSISVSNTILYTTPKFLVNRRCLVLENTADFLLLKRPRIVLYTSYEKDGVQDRQFSNVYLTL